MSILGAPKVSPYILNQNRLAKLSQSLSQINKESKKESTNAPHSGLNILATTKQSHATFQSLIDYLEGIKGQLQTKVPRIPKIGVPDYYQSLNNRERVIDSLSQKIIPEIQKNFNYMIQNATYNKTISLEESKYLQDMAKDILRPFINPRLKEVRDLDSLGRLYDYLADAEDLLENAKEINEYANEDEDEDDEELTQLEKDLENLIKFIKTQIFNLERNPNYFVDLEGLEEELDDFEDMLRRERGYKTQEDSEENFNVRLKDFNKHYFKVKDEVEDLGLEKDKQVKDIFSKIDKIKRRLTKISVVGNPRTFKDIRDSIKDLDEAEDLLKDVETICEKTSLNPWSSNEYSSRPQTPRESDDESNDENIVLAAPKFKQALREEQRKRDTEESDEEDEEEAEEDEPEPEEMREVITPRTPRVSREGQGSRRGSRNEKPKRNFKIIKF